jgi:two-component system, NtrC family, sensor histidine kinase KinB
LNIQNVSIYDIISRAEQSVANALKEKNITLKKEIDKELPLLKADAEKSAWILNNFLTNAIKYSPENDSIIIKAFQKDNFIEVGIRDYGIGIEQNFQTKIFDRYFKVPGTGEKKGTGLGLAISKDFAEAMNGNIGVESQIGKGAYFFFRLPLA